MYKKLLLFTVFVISWSLVSTYRTPHKKLIINGRPFFGLRPPRRPLDSITITRNKEAFPDLNFTQVLDHFNSSSDATWQQRYWHNGNYAMSPDAPQFMMMGQEGPGDNRDVADDNIPFHYWGKQVGAGLWSLEHRFYGKSRPFEQQTTENLKYLTSRQYLADVANFIRYQNKALNLTSSKWIVFGGSYSGALALWFRELYPELAIGAVGSSGPVEPALDFYNYLAVCENSYRMYSDNCADSIGEAMKVLEDDIEFKNGRETLDVIFDLSPNFENLNLTYKDLQNFMSTVIGNFMTAVQYSRVNGGPFEHDASIPDICDIMEVPSSNPVMKLAQVNQYMSQIMNGGDYEGTPNSYAAMIAQLQNPTYDDKTGDQSAASRSWTWQTCNEFGYFQTTDAGKSIWGSKIPNNFYIDMCTDVFGPEYDVDYIKKAVAQSKLRYGGNTNYNGTNVVMPNGNVDPWHALGNYRINDPSVIPILINGTAHCADMEPPNPNDPPSLVNARNIIFENIQKWLAEYDIGSKKVDQKSKNPDQYSEMKTSRLTYNANIDVEFKKSTPSSKRSKFFLGRHSKYGFLSPPTINADDLNSTFNCIQQPIDHNDLNSGTFCQRWWQNDKFYKQGGPIFLMISGESAAGAKWIENENVTWLTLAKQFGAMAYMVEHRYYGGSRPTSDLSTTNLRWLSSEQALADLAEFIQVINHDRGYVNPKWVTFGGSYSGALSAWFRQNYPDITFAAVGSSGPVLAKTDFFEYLEVVNESIHAYNSTCADQIKAGFEKAQQLLNRIDGRHQLCQIFDFCPGLCQNQSYVPVKDVQNFMSDLIGSFQTSVQYSGDNTPPAMGKGIPEICNIMLNTSNTPIENLQNANIFMNGEGCLDPSYSSMIAELQDTTYGDIADSRCWLWQTCTEFGYFQSTDLGRNIFGSPVPVDFYIDMCTDIFGEGFNRSSIDQSIGKTLSNYGGVTNYKGTKVILPNGSVDPWHALGKLDSSDPSVVPIFINGTAHCADMYPARPEDLPGLVQARQKIQDTLSKWLSD